VVSNRRKIGGGILVATGLVALIVPFLLIPSIQPVTTPPPPPGGNHGGNNGGGKGGTTPTCTINCGQSTDNQPPQTTIHMTGMIQWPREDTPFYYPNFTITLHALDDENLSSIILNDTGRVTNFHVQGRTSLATITITANGLHMLSYYSTDQAGNKEAPRHTIIGLAKPDLSDLQSLIANSGINNAGIKNALTVKVETAQDQLAVNQSLDALNALSNQINSLGGKHGLDQAQADLILAVIRSITA
jgi:hypothetical protein